MTTQETRNLLESLLEQPGEYYRSKLKERFGDFGMEQVSQVILFGAAEMGKIYIDLCKKNNIEVLAVGDNNAIRSGSLLDDISVISVTELEAYSKDTPIIISTIHDDEVYRQLAGLGFTRVFPHYYFSILYPDKFYNPHWISSIDELIGQKDAVMQCFDMLADDISRESYVNIIRYRFLFDRDDIKKIVRPTKEEYFDEQIAPLDPQEVFVDGGAYTGDTVARFLQATKGTFKAVHSFEPDTISVGKLKAYIDSLADPRVQAHPFGLGESRGSLKFSNQGTLGSKASESGETTVEIVDLDTFLADIHPTLIKLDIEGCELDALHGARHIIASQAPKLAVCVYHKPADLWQLPILLKEMVPEYRLFIRHYSPFLYDTVCYAVK